MTCGGLRNLLAKSWSGGFGTIWMCENCVFSVLSGDLTDLPIGAFAAGSLETPPAVAVFVPAVTGALANAIQRPSGS